jgi:hypothetical protein
MHSSTQLLTAAWDKPVNSATHIRILLQDEIQMAQTWRQITINTEPQCTMHHATPSCAVVTLAIETFRREVPHSSSVVYIEPDGPTTINLVFEFNFANRRWLGEIAAMWVLAEFSTEDGIFSGFKVYTTSKQGVTLERGSAPRGRPEPSGSCTLQAPEKPTV